MHMSLVVYSFFLGVLVRWSVRLLCLAFGVWLFLDGNGSLFYESCMVKTISIFFMGIYTSVQSQCTI
jgi:hypothetical protein